MVDYGPQAPRNTTSNSSTRRKWVCHARMAYGRHRCNAVHVVCCLPCINICLGCVPMTQRTDNKLSVLTLQNKSSRTETTGKWSYPLPPRKKNERSPRDPECTDGWAIEQADKLGLRLPGFFWRHRGGDMCYGLRTWARLLLWSPLVQVGALLPRLWSPNGPGITPDSTGVDSP